MNIYREDVAMLLDSVSVNPNGICKIVNDEIESAQKEKRTFNNDIVEAKRQEYQRGYKDAITVIAIAFGICPNTFTIKNEDGLFPKIDDFNLPYWTA